MQIRYDPTLVDAALSAVMQQREAGGDPSPRQQYHALAEGAYRLPPSAREEAFRQITQRLFQEWHLAAPLEAILLEFPDLDQQIQTLWIVRARTARDEGADLQFPERRAAVIQLLPRRFVDPHPLARLLRHELMHLADMLDPAFAYEPTEPPFGVLLGENALVRDRYRLLWDITIDSRILRAGRETVADKEERRREFEGQYGCVPGPVLEQAFGRLWERPRPSHPALIEMALDPGRTLFEAWSGTLRALPGSRCPLCRFPSRSLRQGIEEIPGALVEEIRRDFPEWQPTLGACERCLEGYAVALGAL